MFGRGEVQIADGRTGLELGQNAKASSIKSRISSRQCE